MPDVSNGFKIYDEGKHRRYTLLFAVNGGAFAIANVIGKNTGGLTLRQLSLGMILFTAVMVWDIFEFGKKMRAYDSDLFKPIGKAILLIIGFLICAGWFLVAWPTART
jgi:hypothetical protein